MRDQKMYELPIRNTATSPQNDRKRSQTYFVREFISTGLVNSEEKKLYSLSLYLTFSTMCCTIKSAFELAKAQYSLGVP